MVLVMHMPNHFIAELLAEEHRYELLHEAARQRAARAARLEQRLSGRTRRRFLRRH